MLRFRIIGARRLSSSVTPVTVRRSHPIRNFVLKTASAVCLFYGAGLALAVNNDKANEIFVENIPYAEGLVDAYENYRAGIWPSVNVSDVTRKIKDSYNYIRNPIGGIQREEPVMVRKEPTLAAIPRQPMAKLILPTIEVDDMHLAVSELVSSLNASIQAVNDKCLEIPQESFYAILGSYGVIAQAIKSMNNEVGSAISKELTQKTVEAMKDLNEKFAREMKTKSLELSQEYMKNFEAFKKQLEQSTQEQLQADLKAHEQALLARQRNEVAQLSIKQVEEFNKIIETKLEKERNGRLANLQELDQAVSSLIPLFEVLEQRAVKKECLTQLNNVVNSLRTKLSLASDTPVDLAQDIQKLRSLTDVLPTESKCCSNPSLIEIAVSELESKNSYQVASQEQLYNRWLLLQPELKTTSLLPPNAGFLGHLTARLFSTLLFTKEGFSTTRDMDSIIARVTENLRTNRLDKALGDVVDMTGWSRKCTEDWIHLARQRLEVLALIDVIDSEIKTL
ncbi:HBR426Wp [Eremothecium sinecaudum]|uniref:MICOS complex subunit MIC60 n=1 Tax=Eremothecium sinecaudum TaxID=45286 RepID=A0A109UY89_9SACH|nr:HBR426Wp [Eremothecium sinecaudum]AMD19327.1 HBR426Wp [Eremothecium sinecaudum]